MNTHLSIGKCQGIEFHFTISIVCLSLKGISFSIFQYEAKFTIFKFTSCKSFAEVKLSGYWSYCIVVEFSIFWHCNRCAQKTCSCIFRYINFYDCIHIIVVDVGICSSYFTYSVRMRTYFIVRNRVKLDSSISRIFLSLDDIAIFNQLKCEGICCKLFTFQFFSELELSLCRTRCEGIVELCIRWKRVSRFKDMSFLSNSDAHFSLHCIVSHTSFFIFWNNFFYSVLVSTNLSIIKG